MYSSHTFLILAPLAIIMLPIGLPAENEGVEEGKCALQELGKSPPLAAIEKERIAKAIERAVLGLRKSQLKTGSWSESPSLPRKETGLTPAIWPIGYAALPALTLLECGVDPKDAGIQQAARFVRMTAIHARTYEISLAILFLDKLADPADRPLIKSLALRLIAGQGPSGAWGYQCPLMTPAQEKDFLEFLKANDDTEPPKVVEKFGKAAKGERPTDNSNTQFAILALWAARRHEVPVKRSLAMAEQRFRMAQLPVGWGYAASGKKSGSMTCVGILALAIGRGIAAEAPDDERALPKDEGLEWGLRALAGYMTDPRDSASSYATYVPKGSLNLYFLWSIERVGVLCNLDTIGGLDWYRWGAGMLVRTQNPDGSWSNGGGGSATVDTCFALLFLKRSDLLPDLRETLQKRLTITDPGLDGKGVTPKKGPGDSPKEKKSPGEKKTSLRDMGNPSGSMTSLTPGRTLRQACRTSPVVNPSAYSPGGRSFVRANEALPLRKGDPAL